MNHMQTTADCYIYNDIVRKICIGAYKYQDKIPPIRELCEHYRFASTTIKKAMKQLRHDGFIRGETSRGTHVIFDCNNPRHIEMLKANTTKSALNAYKNLPIPPILFSCMVGMGVAALSDSAKESFIVHLRRFTKTLNTTDPFWELTQQLFQEIIAQANNPFVLDIFDELINHFMPFVPLAHLNQEAQMMCRKTLAAYCTCLSDMLQKNELSMVKPITLRLCNDLYGIPGVVLLALENQNTSGRHRERLYSKVIQSISVQILSGNIKKGEFLLSTPQMCKQYGVSRKTVIKAYELLEILKLIKVIPYQGAKLIVDRNDPDVRLWMQKMLNQWSQDIIYALEILRVIGFDIFCELAKHATGETIERMEQNLDKQWYNAQKHHIPMLITDSLASPLMLTIDSSMMHRHYDFLISFLVKFSAACSFQLQYGDAQIAEQKQAYNAARLAISALKQGDADGFMKYFRISLRHTDKVYQALHNIKFEWLNGNP